MNKKIIVIPIVALIVVFVVNFSLEQPEREGNTVFHVTLADPNLYSNGVYSDSFVLDEGQYSFRFVPNGSSPEILSISLNGESFNFIEDFKLESTSHQTGISEYFTWKYTGKEILEISEKQEISIIINPNGKIMGSVSVYILQN
ncbi:hypothetical protein NZNM25_18050 [Nitrosopumilus zosterae]|uniref:Uncharacterized protein n=1 Tax=Nitrosopumilus zosterae TaxID=718286 RepID=A0A2S2KTN7_9ARCH|nr:hypothetical protein [Nitrosopumilus zosterae]BDQ31941.1 hypothetical protein NZOSNM25_002083 [Nitrosopumilus zosterae]GBH35014.1 hypothetical protein NZNM25_18050 [Nitrosopumilus zosterae]